MIGVFSEYDADWPGNPPVYDTTKKPEYGAYVKKIIQEDLEDGYPLMAGFWHSTDTSTSRVDYYGHAVAIIGSDANADKLIVADGTKTIGDKGIIYKISFEQLFTGDIRNLVYSMNPKRA